MLPKLSSLTTSEMTGAVLWAFAFTGVSVLVGLGKLDTSVLTNLLFALGGAMSLKGKSDGSSSVQ